MKKRVLLIFSILLILSACGPKQSTPTNFDVPQPSLAPQETAEPSPEPTASQEPVPTSTVETPEAPEDLPPEPFLAVTNAGIWHVDGNNGESEKISEDTLHPFADFDMGFSPDRKYYAYRTGFEESTAAPVLVILDLEKRSPLTRLELTGPIIQPDMINNFESPGFDAFRAMLYGENFAWSPDSKRLAFIAARDGDSADVYLYELADETVTRLSDEAGHANSLHWSPDGAYLQYLSTLNFGTGAGWTMEGMWAYDFLHEKNILLEESTSNGEQFFGWEDNDTFLVASQSSVCMLYNLRFIDIEDREQETLFAGCAGAIAYNPRVELGYFSVNEFNNENCQCGEAMDTGLYLFGNDIGAEIAEDHGIERIDDSIANRINYIPDADLFAIYDFDGLQQLLSGNATDSYEIPVELKAFSPYPAPNGVYWAWKSAYQNGLWVAERNHNPVELAPQFDGNPHWSRDGQKLFFIEGNRIYSANAPQFDSVNLLIELPVEEIIGLMR